MREQRELRAQGKMVENERVEEREGGELGFEKNGNCSLAMTIRSRADEIARRQETVRPGQSEWIAKLTSVNAIQDGLTYGSL